MHLSRTLKSVFAIALLVVASGFVMGQRGAFAQDEESHPAHIHSGTCEQLGDVVYPLSNVSDSTLVNGTPIAGAAVGSTDTIPVAVSGTTVQATLASLLASPYAINIHESAENIGNYIACGNIGGTMTGSTDLVFGLGQLNESGYAGVATLHDNGDGTTAVSVYLAEEYAETGDGEIGTPATEDSQASTEQNAQAPAAAQVSASIANFAFDPTPLTVNVGDTVTWTNNDSAAHTVTADDGSFQSGPLQQGESFSFTFTTPGTIDYHCEFHANMHGQIVVQ